jgi:predicted GIY-YIG superfamily endonuclease
MFWRKKKNICEYWDCNKGIPDDDFLCAEHYQKWIDASIDKCPKCNRFKDITERLCLDCQLGRQVKPKKLPAETPKPKQYRKGSSEAKTDGYVRPGRCFIYILEFGEGDFNIGYTADVYRQFPELREQKNSATAGHKARLQYLELAVSEEAAKLREAELKILIKTNPDQIRTMASDFHKHMRELGLEKD